MTLDDFKKLLPKISKLPLSRDIAHRLLAPPSRAREHSIAVSSNVKAMDVARMAAVMVLVYPKNNSMHFVLIERPAYSGVHSGQIAFPGGKKEASDSDFLETALRETKEEIGVEFEKIKQIRALTKLYIPPSNFWVYPFLGYAETTLIFQPQQREVAAIVEVSLNDLLNERFFTNVKLTNSYGVEEVVPAFKLNDYTVWGATAMVLNEFKMLLFEGLQV